MKIEEFLLKNKVNNNVEKEVFVSQRFTDEDGKLITFKIRNITNKETEDIRRLPGNKSNDVKIVSLACVEPNFNSVNLQKAYGVYTGEDAVYTILLPGEISILAKQILELSGYSDDINELIEEAKKH